MNEDQTDKVGNLICVGADTNNTLIMSESIKDGVPVIKRSTGKENHMVVTAESGTTAGEYLTHCDIPLVGATGTVHAEHLYKVLEEYDSLSTIEAVLLDNTSVNTGHKTLSQ